MVGIPPNAAAAPEAQAETQPYWDAAAQGTLLLKRCQDTGTVFHYPREHSPFTGGPTDWVAASGLGRVYSCSVSHRAAPPYCIAYVKLDEGPIIMTNVVGCDLAQVAIGQRVRAVFQPGPDGRPVPFFTPID